MAGSIIGGAISAVGSIIGGNSAKQGAQSAANSSSEAARYSADVQRDIFNATRDDQAPWRYVGNQALNQLNYLLGAESNHNLLQTWPSENFKFNFKADPGYNWRLSEGLKSLDRSAAAKGGLQSGAALKAAAQYGQNFASNEYQNAYNRWNNDTTNAYNRWNTDQNNRFNKLSATAGLGQVANNQLASSGANYANNIGNIAMTNAATQGNAAMANANANASMYGGIANSLAYGLGNSNSLSNIGNFFGGNYGASGNWTNPDTGSTWWY